MTSTGANFEFVGLVLFAFLGVLPAVPWLLILLRIATGKAIVRRWRKLALASLVAIVSYASVCVDAFILEPNWPRLERVSIGSAGERPLTVLQLSDLHLEQDMAHRDAWLIRQVEKLQPDLVVLTGDTT